MIFEHRGARDEPDERRAAAGSSSRPFGGRGGRTASLRLLGLVLSLSLAGLPALVWAEQAVVLETVDAGSASDLVVEAVPGTVVLGSDQTVVLRIRSGDGPDAPAPMAMVNVGSLGPIVPAEPGVYTVEYSPPPDRFPQLALIALHRPLGRDAPVSFFMLPLLGTARVPVRTSPGAEVTVTVDGRPFGPFQADDRGRAEARLEVPPGARRATVTAVDAGGRTTSQEIDLDVPPFDRLVLVAVPSRLPADGVSRSRLHLYHHCAGVPPCPAAPGRVLLRADAGEITAVERGTGPVYHADFVAPRAPGREEVTITASVRGDPSSSADATLSLRPQELARIEVRASSPSTVVADGDAFVDFSISMTDEQGVGFEGAVPSLELVPEDLDAETRLVEIGDGRYSLRVAPARLDPPASRIAAGIRLYAGEIEGGARFELLPWAPARVHVEPLELRLVADGRSAARLTVRAYDAKERPLDHLEPRLSASSGSITSVTPVEGVGHLVRYESPRLSYRASPRGRTTPPVSSEAIHVEVGGREARAGLILTAGVEEPWFARSFFELGAGYRRGDRLSGAQAMLHVGMHLSSNRWAKVGGGLWSGGSLQLGEWEVVGFGEDDGMAKARLITVPLLAIGSVELRRGSWSIGAGAGGGLMIAIGDLRLAHGEDLEAGGTLPAYGGRAFLRRGAGPGSFFIDLSYLNAMRDRQSGRADVTGQLGGLGGTVGFRVER